MRESVDAEELERRLAFRKLDLGEEKLGSGRSVVVSEKRSGDDAELAAKLLKTELGFAVELSSVEEDEHRVWPRSGSGCEEFGDSMVVEMDYA